MLVLYMLCIFVHCGKDFSVKFPFKLPSRCVPAWMYALHTHYLHFKHMFMCVFYSRCINAYSHIF